MVKVSVIVPVYNVELYLDKCLQSIVNQRLNDIEIIIVNDGTKDNSQQIIDEYSNKHPDLIRPFIKKNGGLSSARNFGIEKARGKYISFVDSDDYIDENMMLEMYNYAEEGNYDVVACDLEYIYEDHTQVVSSNILIDLNNKDEIKKRMIDIYPAACNKIYKRNLFDKNKFKIGVWYEDVEFMYRILPLINSIGIIKKPFYKYVQHQNAITSTFNSKIFDYIDNWNGLIDYYKKEGIYDYYKDELEYCYVRYLYATMVKGLLHFEDYSMYNNGVDLAIKNVKRNFPNYRSNKLFYLSFKGIYLVIFNKLIALILYKIKKHK